MKGSKVTLFVSLLLIISIIAVSPKVLAIGGQAHGPILIIGNNQFTFANGVSSGAGTQQNPYVIEDLIINASSACGIDIRDTTANFVIRDCLIESNGINLFFSVSLESSDNGVILNNTCLNSNVGIHLFDSSYNVIKNNDINVESSMNLTEIPQNETFDGCNNVNGIALYSSPHNDLIGNICDNNYHVGIKISNSPSVNLVDNYCTNNHLGIYLENSSDVKIDSNICNANGYGIGLSPDSSDNIICNNTCFNNDIDGIYLNSSTLNNIVSNVCMSSQQGMRLFSSTNNTITSNLCSNNQYSIELLFSSYNTLSNNTCVNNLYSNDIQIQNSTNNSLIDNEVRIPQTFSASNPITLDIALSILIYLPISIGILAIYSKIKKKDATNDINHSRYTTGNS